MTEKLDYLSKVSFRRKNHENTRLFCYSSRRPSLRDSTEGQTSKTKVKVGKIYNCAIEGFSGLVRAECLKIYEKSAHVRIIVCHKEQDEWRQKVLGDQTVVKLKNMVLAR